MKKLLLSCILLSLAFGIKAQYTEKTLALQLVIDNSKTIGLSDNDLRNVIVSSSYYDKLAGLQMVYLQQSYQGLPVYNEMQVLAFRNGKLVSAAGERIAGLGKVSGMISAVPAISAEQAVKTALSEKKVIFPESRSVNTISTTKFDFGKSGIANENITAELMWIPVENGEVKLAWQVYFVPKTSSDYFLIQIDAKINKVISENNLTVYCNFGNTPSNNCAGTEKKTPNSFANDLFSPTLVNTVNYLVVPYPAESPIHPGGTPAIRTNPWLMAPGNATSLGWQNDGATDYSITRGNNVWAQEDRDNNNNTMGTSPASSTTPDPLNFDFVPNFAVSPLQTTPVSNQQFNITNLFYWNNIVHDLTYLYGFDEVAGNFQNDNQGRGGNGVDYVIADAQDAGGTNNANFSTPVDGQRPRMQMYLWGGSPQKDGDADNGIVVHEYGHGISNRLTGGPANTSCLQNAEQMGEGWSDYYALMYTQDWANSNLNSGFASPRGMGTYVINQPFTGTGIRSQKYCTNFAINNKVYAPIIPAESHDRGEIWCATLWDMTWNIINQVGSINPNLFNPAGGGGNTIALRLVTEGLKLQPCSPGFISSRDAILQADQVLYGGAYNCAIREAFRRRGMGDLASQGSSGSVTDQVTDFSGGVSLLLSQNGMTQVEEGQNIIYTNTVNSSCAAITGFTLRDTLPSNVTYVSGGSYDAVNRVVSFPVTQAAGAVQNYSFTVNVNPGSYFTPVTLLDEQVNSATIPASWTTTATPAANVWTVSSLQSVSPPNSFYVENLTIATDQKIETTNAMALPTGTSPRLSFSHKFNTEDGWDGGVAEISSNGGPWVDLGPYMITGGYNGTLGNNPPNILSNRSAFTGTINSFMTTTVNLTAFAGQNVKIRFRFASDDNTSAPSGTPGWFVDNILLNVTPVVNMRSSLFNNTNVRVALSDTITVIIPAVICTAAGISAQPVNTSACPSSNATFGVTATGSSPSYQWQISTDGGSNWADIPGATSSTYTVTAVTAAMDNYRYRVVINNTCPSTITSNSATLTISSTASITTQPADFSVCPGTNAVFTVSATGSNLTYQWEQSTDGGLNYTTITGATAATLTLPAINQSANGNKYRVIVLSCSPTGITSNAATLSIINPVAVSLQPVDITICAGNTVSFTVNGSGAGLTYQWQVSTNGGGSFTNITGQTNPTLTLTNVLFTQNGNLYQAVLAGTCGSVNSTAALLTINTPVAITTPPQDVAGCSGSDVTFTVDATGTSITYQWQLSINGGPWVDLNNISPYSGVNTATLNIGGASTSMSGYRYRVIVSGVPCGGITSSSATLNINQKPGVVLVAAEYNNLTPGVRSTLYTTVSPVGVYTYEWFRNGILLQGVTSASYPVDVDRFGDYSVTVTDINGCSATSNLVHIGDSVTNVVFIYPNPNMGHFHVRFYSPNNVAKVRQVNIYDSKGARVYQKQYSIGRSYEDMDVSLLNVSAGVYMLDLRDVNGGRLATASVLIQ